MKIVNIREIRNEHNVTLAEITPNGNVKFPYPSTEYSADDLRKIIYFIEMPDYTQPRDRE